MGILRKVVLVFLLRNEDIVIWDYFEDFRECENHPMLEDESVIVHMVGKDGTHSFLTRASGTKTE